MDKWEYKAIQCTGGDLEATLIPLGEHGWEVDGFAGSEYAAHRRTNAPSSGIVAAKQWGAAKYWVLLKRRKQ
jgi:hypothetical protein